MNAVTGRRLALSVSCLVLALVPWCGGSQAAADSFFDIFVDVGCDRLDFGLNPLPLDFFGPGSQPFDGIVPLAPLGGFGPPRDSRLGGGPLNPGLPEQVPIELLSMVLTSVNPITVTSPPSDSELWRIVVQVQPAGSPNGAMDLAPDDPQGGLIVDSFFDVFFQISFESLDSGATRSLPPFPSRLILDNGPVPFVYDRDPSDGVPDEFFFDTLRYRDADNFFLFELTPLPVPEPASIWLALAGAAGLARMRRVGRGNRSAA